MPGGEVGPELPTGPTAGQTGHLDDHRRLNAAVAVLEDRANALNARVCELEWKLPALVALAAGGWVLACVAIILAVLAL